jgi:hypothetical protein
MSDESEERSTTAAKGEASRPPRARRRTPAADRSHAARNGFQTGSQSLLRLSACTHRPQIDTGLLRQTDSGGAA